MPGTSRRSHTHHWIHGAGLAYRHFGVAFHQEHLPFTLVVGKWHRRKVDLARARKTSATSVQGRQAWDNFHGLIEKFLDQAIEKYGYAHLIEYIYGQSHRLDTTEVGNLLTNAELRQEKQKFDPNRSSLTAMMS